MVQHPSFHPARFRRHKLRLFPMIGAEDKKIEIGDNSRGAAAVVFGGGPAIKEADGVEIIDTTGSRYASAEVWVGLREE